MRRHPGRAIALALLGAGLAALPAASYTDYSYVRIVRLSLVEGDVQLARPEQGEWEAALLNMPLQQGYSLATGYGRAEVEFESGATARLAQDSVLRFTELALSNGNRLTQLTLDRGTATFYANLARRDVFRVLTPNLEVNVPDHARFRVDVEEGGTSVSVLKGDVAVETRAGSYRVTKGRTLRFWPGASEEVALYRTGEPDDWDRWVAERDEAVLSATNTSLRYVNSPFRYGLGDLSSYGNWFYVSGYGRCWQPWNVPLGWTPYWNGRWVYLHNVGWTWVSYEPWGWVPYHYGRWAYTGYGWAWIPGYFNTWHPGLVYWVQIGNFVGWGPLGPGHQPGVVLTNVPHGTVVVTTPRGLVTGARGRPHKFANDERPVILAEAPAPHNPPRPDGRQTPAWLSPRGAAVGGTAAEAGTPILPPKRSRLLEDGGEMARPPRTTGTAPEIIYDPREQRYVNNPSAPPRRFADDEAAPKPARPFFAPHRPATSGDAPAAPAAVSPPANRAPDADARVPRTWPSRPRESTDAPRPAPPSAPPRNIESPRAPRYAPTAPSPRTESRPAPVVSRPPSARPRSEAPRPSAPPPSAPRSYSPPPQLRPSVSSPRPSAPPPAPRSEPRVPPKIGHRQPN
jgi:hypothetical protein